MHDSFDMGLPFILSEEIGPFTATAGYVSPERAQQIHDTGGETLAGIARNANPDWPGWAIVDQRKSEPDFPHNLNLDLPQNAELRAQVGARYRVNYWDAFRCGELPPVLALALFDAAVQHQPKTAVALVQQAIGVAADGIIGPMTIARAQIAGADALTKYCVFRAELYMDLITADSRKAVFRDTWFGRVFRLHAYLLANPRAH